MSKKELILEIKPRYLKADKTDKGLILDEFCRNTGYNRSYAIRILQPDYDYQRVSREGRRRRSRKYDAEILTAVIKIWEILDYPCGTRLQPMIKPMLETLARCGELKLNEKIIEQLKIISAKTLDRRLKREREIRKLDKHRGTTRHGSLLKSSIPIRITDWNTAEVGFMEIDTVAHNGGDPSGEFIYSLDMVEIFSGWSEQIAVLGKGERGIVQSINTVKTGLPFELFGLDSDNGSEFVNYHLVRYCQEKNLYFTRSRPNRKNDNAYVEQKNYTHVRRWLGYGRFDNEQQLKLINNLYRQELSLYNNFFRPVMKIISKEKINNSICRKKYDRAKTPYQRLLESDQISPEQKQKLTETYLSLNPVQLKLAVDRKIKKIRATQTYKLNVPTR